ncbi:MAG: serine/threonine protein kinase, partial [Myxococcales bacterium]|nr:serine/threonine protein kinase [Myxococcales bacterium]
IDLITYIIGEVLAALDYAHERNIGGADAGVIHSDVTPGNIMISSSGEVKLTDFGIACLAATAGPMSHAVGTPRYMSPEQMMGHPQRETDIYSLGVVLHELLEDRRFLAGLTPDQFRSRVLMGPPPALERGDVPDWLDDLRRRMLATQPEDRPRANEARALLIEHCPRY